MPRNIEIEEVINNVAAQTTHKPVEILLVEDNLADVRLMKEALKEIKNVSNLTVVNDGVEAMAFLHGKGKCEGAGGRDCFRAGQGGELELPPPLSFTNESPIV